MKQTETENLRNFNLSKSLNDFEHRAFSAAVSYSKCHNLSNPPDQVYLNELPSARKTILSRFVGGLLRDCPEGLPDPTVIELNESLQSNPPSIESVGPRTNEALDDITWPDNASRLGVISFPASNGSVIAPVETTIGFDRHLLNHPFWKITSSDPAPLGNPEELLDMLEKEGVYPDDDEAQRFRREIRQSVANLALARLAGQRFRSDLSADTTVLLDPSSKRNPSAADRFALFERLVTEGHPFHPGAKIRDGMNASDSLSYAPELSSDINFSPLSDNKNHHMTTRVSPDDDNKNHHLSVQTGCSSLS